jgi:hypothetical protein
MENKAAEDIVIDGQNNGQNDGTNTERNTGGMRRFLYTSVLLIIGLALTLYLGYRPGMSFTMKPGFFPDAEAVGTAAFESLPDGLGGESVVVIGVPTNPWSAGVVKGVVKSAEGRGNGFKKIVAEARLAPALLEELKALVPDVSVIESNSPVLAELGDAVQEARASDRRVLLVLPNVYSSHLIVGNPIRRLEQGFSQLEYAEEGRDLSLPSVTIAPLALDPSEEKTISPICIGSERDAAGTSELGCAIIQAGRALYRRRLLDTAPDARQQFVATMQMPQAGDYLLLVRAPDVAPAPESGP